MASRAPFEHFKESFFTCSVCLDQFKEPKQLPCLHRYCKECLQTLIQTSNNNKVNCPLCNQKCTISANGIEDFQTDFLMKSMLEFLQLQKSWESHDLKKRMSCLKNTKVSAYCFKCKGFLCEACHDIHVSTTTFNGHQPHTLSLNDIKAKNLSLERMAALTEAPKCHIHDNADATLCCSSCGNLPICFTCIHGYHKEHDYRGVGQLAGRESELLEENIAELKHNRRSSDLQRIIEITTRKVSENVATKTEELTNQHIQQVCKNKYELAECTTNRERGLFDIGNIQKQEESQISFHLEKEISQVKEKYDHVKKTAKRAYDDEAEKFNEECNKIEGALCMELSNIDASLKDMRTVMELHVKEREIELKGITDCCDQVIKRYENVIETASSSFLATKDKWTYVQCIPDIRAACAPLKEDMDKEFLQLESLSDVATEDTRSVDVDDVTITKNEESVFDVRGIKTEGWWINGIAYSVDDYIVVTGRASSSYSHITVINRRGEIQRQDQIKCEKTSFPNRFCCFLSKFKVVTACWPREVGLYDVRDGSYNKTYFNDISNGWFTHRQVKCLTKNPVSNDIIVGTDRREVYIFDYRLNYSYTISLPNVIRGSHDITVHRGSLLVCDYDGKRAYAVTMEGSESEVMYEFTKPDIGDACRPLNVCTDTKDFVYILWRARKAGHEIRVVVRYSQDGRQLLTTYPVDDNCCCMANSSMNGAEQLILATCVSGKLYTYDLR
ncbi:hypothetical protein BSL78_20196 [Apostichopus japonicus]|uniref:RING-type domain-containing protein n=1 Tax=Stichopus japonicus TaxID=307972 RepID=A0A2G8K4S2_STIJA|nr:hypothetical protein BSL78_20196 [Apostichopus japonicus]